jgi:hypothetical protein
LGRTNLTLPVCSLPPSHLSLPPSSAHTPRTGTNCLALANAAEIACRCLYTACRTSFTTASRHCTRVALSSTHQDQAPIPTSVVGSLPFASSAKW